MTEEIEQGSSCPSHIALLQSWWLLYTKTHHEIIYFVENDASLIIIDILLTILIYQKSVRNYTLYQDNKPKGEESYEKNQWRKFRQLIGTGKVDESRIV